MTGREAGGDAELKKELDATLHARRNWARSTSPRSSTRSWRRSNSASTARWTGGYGGSWPSSRWWWPAVRAPQGRPTRGERFGFGIVSLVLAVPLSAIGGGLAHLPGLLVAWAGIVGVNVVQAARVTPNFFGRRRAKSDSDWED